MKRRPCLFLSAAFGFLVLALAGCSWVNGLTMRSQSPDEPESEGPKTRLVEHYAVPYGVQPVRVDAVGLVTGLHGTGSDPTPSPERAALIEEMQKRNVNHIDRLLASGDVSLVLLRGVLRPGIQKGDRFDVELRVPSQSETTSLRGGYLLETRLSESAVLGGRIHRDKVIALAQGPVMVDPTADVKKDRVLACRGKILGGGVSLESRPLGLVILPEHKNVQISSQIANTINKRFNVIDRGLKKGMATAKTDDFIELTVHPRYKENIARYMKVVRSLAIRESSEDRMRRILALESRLLDPLTSADAAIQLEGVGADGVEPLLKGIRSKDSEVRFYAAEALAYLDRREAAEPLAQIARDEPAIRVFALTALSIVADAAARDQLIGLLASPSAETRYGAFRALWAMDSRDSLVQGESFGGQFTYHVLNVSGPPMIHVTRSRLAEIVVFGRDQEFLLPLAVNAGRNILVTGNENGSVSVSRFSVGDGDQKRTVSPRVDDVVRAVVELGGTYPDVVQALQEAKNCGSLAARLEFDALPEAGRTFERIARDQDADGGPNAEAALKEPADDPVEKKEPKKGFFAKIFGR